MYQEYNNQSCTYCVIMNGCNVLLIILFSGWTQVTSYIKVYKLLRGPMYYCDMILLHTS